MLPCGTPDGGICNYWSEHSESGPGDKIGVEATVYQSLQSNSVCGEEGCVVLQQKLY